MNNWNEDMHLENCLDIRLFNSAIKLLKLTNEHVARMWSLLAIQNFIQTNCNYIAIITIKLINSNLNLK